MSIERLDHRERHDRRFCRDPLSVFPAGGHREQFWRGQGCSLFGFCPSSISSADHGVAHPPRCPEGWFWRGCRGCHDLLGRLGVSYKETCRFVLNLFISLCIPCRYSFYPRVTAVARKRPWSFGKSSGGTLQLNTYTPLTQRNREWADYAVQA